MKKGIYGKISILVLLVLLIFGQSFVLAQESSTRGRITVQGRGSVEVKPDQATVYLVIGSQCLSALEAQTINAKKSEEVVKALKELGIKDDQIKTQNIRLYEVWDYTTSERKFMGYKAEYTLKVIINEIEITGLVLDTAVKNGAENIRSIEFGLQDRTQAETEALRNAFAHARSRAQVLAEAAGIELGVPSLIQDQSVIVTPYNTVYSLDSAEMAKVLSREFLSSETTEVQPGTIVIEASVYLEFTY
jgi:uncharacterized protein YggE